jgi:hypothetical protein
VIGLPISLEALGEALQAPVTEVVRAGQGGNSKVFHVRCAHEVEYAVKFYFRNPADGRDRLSTEYSALSFLWDNGVRCVPRPLIADRNHYLAVYEYIRGVDALAQPVSVKDIAEAARFARELHRLTRHDSAAQFAPASEACFSVDDLIKSIQARLRRLSSAEGPAATELHAFLANEFTAAFVVLDAWLTDHLGKAGRVQQLERARRTLSPSDFGFHNARRRDGQLVFFDFEYFGWDDPAKMIADFLLHPAMNLPDALKPLVVEEIGTVFADDSGLPERLSFLYPLFGLKWCTIMLNEFVPRDLSRRQFADKAPEGVRTRQLEKARNLLGRLMRDYDRFPYGTCTAWRM